MTIIISRRGREFIIGNFLLNEIANMFSEFTLIFAVRDIGDTWNCITSFAMLLKVNNVFVILRVKLVEDNPGPKFVATTVIIVKVKSIRVSAIEGISRTVIPFVFQDFSRGNCLKIKFQIRRIIAHGREMLIRRLSTD